MTIPITRDGAPPAGGIDRLRGPREWAEPFVRRPVPVEAPTCPSAASAGEVVHPVNLSVRYASNWLS